MVPAQDFFVSYYQTQLESGEMLVAIHIPTAKKGSGDGFAPMSVGGTDVLNIIAGASTVTLQDDGRIANIAVVVTGAAERPVRFAVVEQQLTGTSGAAFDLDEAFGRFDTTILEPPDDVHASAEYRRDMASVFARRAVEQAVDNARRGFHD